LSVIFLQPSKFNIFIFVQLFAISIKLKSVIFSLKVRSSICSNFKKNFQLKLNYYLLFLNKL
jgi:hypothetical protein